MGADFKLRHHRAVKPIVFATNLRAEGAIS
jgi:hypothetical protein